MPDVLLDTVDYPSDAVLQELVDPWSAIMMYIHTDTAVHCVMIYRDAQLKEHLRSKLNSSSSVKKAGVKGLPRVLSFEKKQHMVDAKIMTKVSCTILYTSCSFECCNLIVQLKCV
jgi:homospermidine synthase